MNFDEYKNTDEYPRKPHAPTITSNATPDEYRKHAVALEQHATDLQVYRNELEKWNVKQAELETQFSIDALADVGLTDHPKADKCFSFAWEHGHSSGYHEVYYWLEEIAELML